MGREDTAEDAPRHQRLQPEHHRASLEELASLGGARRELELQRERVTLYRPSYLPGIELWSVQASSRLWTILYELYSFSAADWGRPDWERCANTTRYLRGTHKFGGTDLLVGSLGELSRVTAVERPVYFHALNIQPQLALEWLPRGRALHCAKLARADLYQAFHLAWQAVESELLDVTEREHYLRSFLARSFAAASDQPPLVAEQTCARKVRRARELIHDRSSERLTLAEIAHAVGCSAFHLERSFGAVMGLPLHAYLQQVRLARAMSLLRQGCRLAVASSRTGFADQAHMTRAFRKWFGVTPRAFQRATSVRVGPEAAR